MNRLLLLSLLMFSGLSGAVGSVADLYLEQVEELSRNIREIEKTLLVLKKQECPVCLMEFDDSDDIWILPKIGARCGHALHTDCISQWASQKLTCPACRENLSLNDVPQLPKLVIDFNDYHENFWEGSFYLGGKGLRSIAGINDFERAEETRIINLRGNYLNELPARAFEKYENLEELHFYANHLFLIDPDAFQGLPNLKKLILGNTNIGPGENQLQLNADILAPIMGSLEELDISDNNLTVLPEWVNLLGGLKALSLDGNQLQLTADTFEPFILLEELDLADNQLTHLPVEMLKKLPRLIKLDLSGNNFSPAEQERIQQEVINPDCEIDFKDDDEVVVRNP